MTKALPLITIMMLFAAGLHAQQTIRYTVKFRYKKSDSYSLAQPSAFLSAKAIERREKQKLTIDSTDLPLNRGYVETVKNIPGVSVSGTSKWLNEVLIETNDPSAISKINALPFVLKTKAVVYSPSAHYRKIRNIASADPEGTLSPATVKHITSDSLNYGTNYPQVHIHEGEYLHNLGFHGNGITIAILDAGFSNYKTNPAFDSIRINNRVLGEYDFVQDEASVNEDHTHGANCLSIMAANLPGQMIGTAPDASYWLFRTEDASSEKPVEEFNWIEGAERADSAGADMISSSLGYVNFDDPSFNHPYSDRDGNSTAITRAADLAAKKGMIVMNSIGNSGGGSDDTRFVNCPADGDSVFAVGAVNTLGVVAGFSSYGPSASGKVKPNVVSVGSGTVYTNNSGQVVTGNGTSYSNPNMAGLIACLWQAFDEFNNMEILDAVQKSADHYNNPDDRYGYGIPNFRIAYSLLEAKRDERTNAILNGRWIKAFPVPFTQLFTLSVKAPSTGTANIRVFDMTGRVLLERNLTVRQGENYTVRLSPQGTKRYGVYYVQYSDGKNQSTIRLLGL